jgi:hypothetical protein
MEMRSRDWTLLENFTGVVYDYGFACAIVPRDSATLDFKLVGAFHLEIRRISTRPLD